MENIQTSVNKKNVKTAEPKAEKEPSNFAGDLLGGLFSTKEEKEEVIEEPVVEETIVEEPVFQEEKSRLDELEIPAFLRRQVN